MTDSKKPDNVLTLPILQKLLEQSRVNMVRMHLQTTEGTLPLTASKLGGMGYLPVDETYPRQADGTPLALLTQINFAEVADVVDLAQLPYRLPDKGLLQVYIGNTDFYGADFDNPYPSDTYQVRYWTDLSLPVNQAELDAAKVEVKQNFEEDYSLPFNIGDEFAVTFSQARQSCSIMADDDHEGIIAKILPELSGADVEDYIESQLKAKGIKDIDPYDVVDQYDGLAGIGGHQLLGYPFFTQSDPREYNETLKQHILLFQFDSDDEVDMMWGDSGVANFFIAPQALAKRDFSQLVYNWDCC